jgi:predicted transcriptional regulator of viral defense system
MERADILNILRSDKTVFSFQELLLTSKDKNPNLLIRRLNYYIKKGELYSIRKGLYAKDKSYNKFEAVNKIYTPSYISFETVLGKTGIIFQYYSQIFIASYLTREIIADGQIYSYRKIKDFVLTDNTGVEQKDNYAIATPERAFLDVVYLNKNYHFDNLSILDWNRIFEILPIYSNKRMEKDIKSFQKML